MEEYNEDKPILKNQTVVIRFLDGTESTVKRNQKVCLYRHPWREDIGRLMDGREVYLEGDAWIYQMH